MISSSSVVAYQSESAKYPALAPYHPSEHYPENASEVVSPEDNPAYRAVRGCFRFAGLDGSRYGTRAWSPLGQLLRPGDLVLLKPNLVKESHPRDADGWQYVLTHGSIIRAVTDYIWKALDGRGRVVVADAPQTDSSFASIVSTLGLDSIRDFYRQRGLDLELQDLRREEWVNRDGVIVSRRALTGDPHGYVACDIGAHSEFVGHSGAGRYYGADYNRAEVNYHHADGRHEYVISRLAMDADVVISIPKLKTHKKAGITVSLKNLIGINGDKNYLPHHTEGSEKGGGDESPDSSSVHAWERRLVRAFQRLAYGIPGVGPLVYRGARRVGLAAFGDSASVVRSGNWWGNDTIWRTCLDLNKILLYANSDGTLRPPGIGSRKRHYVLVDGIIAGEGNGPIDPDPVAAGLVLFGTNPAHVDAVAAWLMGFSPECIPIVSRAFCCDPYTIADGDWQACQVVSNVPEWNGPVPDLPDWSTYHFRPPVGWLGHIERRPTAR